MINKNNVKDLFDYDPETGILLWKNIDTKPCLKGKEAGSAHYMPNGYIDHRVTYNQQQYQKGRVIWLYQYGDWPKHTIDFADGDSCNFAISNLRDANKSQQRANSVVSRNNKLGIKGIHEIEKKGYKYFIASVRKDKKTHQRYFNQKDPGALVKAKKWLASKRKKLFGEFAHE